MSTNTESVVLRRARVILLCEAGGCDATYTYLTREHAAFPPEVEIADVIEARAAAHAWGWTAGDPHPQIADDRCPRHPVDEYLLDSGD